LSQRFHAGRDGALGVNTTGIDSRPLTKAAGRKGNAD
jgi:hypothetical protein